MHYCSTCGHENLNKNKFCSSCGETLTLVPGCPACGHAVIAGSKFCGQCGARLSTEQLVAKNLSRQQEIRQGLQSLMPASLAQKISAAKVEIAGERREVTALILGVVNSTTTAQALNSEEIYLFTDQAMRLLAEVVYKYEGIIDKYTGDGLVALFGAPVTHENDPERAVRAALEMQTQLQPLQKQFTQEYGLEFQMRIGINTGLVIAGKTGHDMHMEYTVVGNTINLAARLEAAARLDTIAASFITYQRTRPFFKYKTLTPFRVKGVAQPVKVFRPLNLRAQPKQTRGLSGFQSPMMGREDALARLQSALAEVIEQRHSRVVFVTGEAGIGKSRLLKEFRRSGIHIGSALYQGNCLSYVCSKPFWLIADLLRDIMPLQEIDSPEAERERVYSYLSQFELARDDIFPYLINVLGLEQVDPETDLFLRRLDSETLRKLIHAALRQVLLAEARRGPIVLILEDLHWVDPASRDFLEHLIQSVDDNPLLLVLTSRQTERETIVKPLITVSKKYHQHLVDIQLNPLSSLDGQLLVAELLKRTSDETQLLKNRIAERAGGIPLFAEEIIRMLVDQGGLIYQNQDDTWQVAPQAAELLGEVPGTLNGLILARFDRLGEELRRTLQIASVLGTSFPIGLLQLLNDSNSQNTVAQLYELETRQFLVAKPSEMEENYLFRHALVQEAVYQTLLKRDRKKLHEHAALAIEQNVFWPPDEQVEALAYHYFRSTSPEQAIPHLITAAENAVLHGAVEAPIQYYRQALALMKDQSTEPGEQLLRTQMGLGQALKFIGEYSEACQIMEGILQHLLNRSLRVESPSLLPILVNSLRELADLRAREGALDEAITHLEAGLNALGEAGAQENPQLWRLLIDRLAWVRFRQGKLEEAFTLASSATLDLDVARSEDPITLANLFNTLGGIFWQWGNLTEATTYVTRSLGQYQSLGYAWGMAVAYGNLGILCTSQGKWPQAAEYFQQSYALRLENGYLLEQAAALNNLGLLRMVMGDHDQAQQDLEGSLLLSQRLSSNGGIVHAKAGLTQLALIQSRVEEAYAHIEGVWDLLDTVGEDQAIQARWLLAMIQAERSTLSQGLETAEQALQMAQKINLVEEEANCRRVLGVLHTRAGNYLEAEVFLRESADLALQANVPYSQGQALFELGRMYQQRGLPNDPAWLKWQTEALAAFKQAIEQFERLGAAYDLRQAQTALSQIQTEIDAEKSLQSQLTGQAKDSPSPDSGVLPEAEWHTAAIVWLNLEAPPDADEETVFEIIAQAMPALTVIIEERQGQAIRHQRGLTVVFGAPVAYEDDTERAVQTAWDMARYLDELVYETGVQLDFRLAVSQGNVVAGQIGSHHHTEFVVKGEAVQLARQVADISPPGKVWATEAVRITTKRVFLFQPASTDQVDGHVVWKLAGLCQKPAPARGLPGFEARLVGRDSALQKMTVLSRQLEQGVGGLIWIEGEPGIGKSRLMREFVVAVATDNILVWGGKCSPQKSSQAFSVFTDLLAQVFDLLPTDTSDQIRRRVSHVLQTWPQDVQMTQPYLEMLLGIQPSGLGGERLANLEPEQLRQQTFVALRRLLQSLTNEQPMILLLDDLHWIDPMSAELIRFLLTIVTAAPILFVCAQRRQGADSPNDRLVRVQSLIPTQTVQFRLKRLSRTESEEFLAELLPQTALPEALCDTIFTQSEGNPYFIEEFVRMLIEQGHLQYRQEHWQIDPDLNLDEISAPSSLNTLIRSRIDALPLELKQVMQCAAVIGEPFEISLLEFIMGADNIGLALSRLESRLLVCRGTEASHWEFNHSLIETVVYNTMLAAQRKALHLKIAQTLETRWAGKEAEYADILAYHFSRAEDGPNALTYLTLAGERAAARFANDEALTYFEKAAQQLSALPEAADDLRWRLVAGLGDVYRAMGQYEDSTVTLSAGLALVETGQLSYNRRAGLYRRLGETARKQGELDTAYEHFADTLALFEGLSDSQVQREAARILTGLAGVLLMQGRFEKAQQACQASLEHAQSVDALGELATAENLLGGIHYRQSNWAHALHHTMRAMILREQMGYSWGVAASLSNLGVLAVSAGHWDKARSFFERSLILRQEVGDVEGVAIVHNNLGTLTRDQGDLETAEMHFRESLSVALPFKMGWHIANSNIGLARVLLLQDAIAEAQEVIDASLVRIETTGVENVRPELCRVQAEVWLAKSAWDKARTAITQAISLAGKMGDRTLEVAAWRVAAEIERRSGDLQAAHRALDKARQTITDVTDELESGRVAAQIGRIKFDEGQFSQAAAGLQAAKEIFMRLGANLDLKQVEEMLDRMTMAGF